MRAVIYTRTSRREQRSSIQLQPLNKMVEDAGYVLVDTIEDLGVSGGKQGRQRDGMKKLMEMVNRREVDVVLVYSVDRIGRSMGDVISLVQELDDKGVGLVIHKNAIDTTTAMGKTLVGFFALVAQMEKDFINSRTADGIALARASGKHIGRPPLSQSKQRSIIELRNEGLGMNRIAKQLGVGNSQVLRVVRKLEGTAPIKEGVLL
jgi:DNA invertase Pin-like site-specific DNA recombinase